MDKIFYAQKYEYPCSETAVLKILHEYFKLDEVSVKRTKNGKPYVDVRPSLHFSVSHTDTMLFIAFSDQEIGIDAEHNARQVNYLPILKKLPSIERENIRTQQDFLQLWTAKESVVKYLGECLSKGLKEIELQTDGIDYKGKRLPCRLTQLTLAEHVISVCSEKDCLNVEFIKI
ncbi:MAG: 4'-phosphopantetheinyl transferase superfamily protein [Clostridia bacterium]|nr:4'-phosphopantetheinyl transferase superfamily protein [Clostridia bacterium]